MAPTDKQRKAAVKEGGKKGQDVAGMSDLGGVKFFCLAVESALGQWELMDAILEGMNKEVDPNADDRKGGAGHIGKGLLFADEKVLLILCHMPKQLSETLVQADWFSAIIDSVGAKPVGDPVQLPNDGGTIMKAQLEADVDSERFPLKDRDVAISRSFEFLVDKGLVRPEESDDDANYAEMANIDW